jgi:hypothetical protein
VCGTRTSEQAHGKQLESEQLGVSYFRYAPDVRSPIGHSHRAQEEVYVIINGSGRIKLDNEIRELRRWDVVRIAPQTVRALEVGPGGPRIHRDRFRPPRGRRRRPSPKLVGRLECGDASRAALQSLRRPRASLEALAREGLNHDGDEKAETEGRSRGNAAWPTREGCEEDREGQEDVSGQVAVPCLAARRR